LRGEKRAFLGGCPQKSLKSLFGRGFIGKRGKKNFLGLQPQEGLSLIYKGKK